MAALCRGPTEHTIPVSRAEGRGQRLTAPGRAGSSRSQRWPVFDRVRDPWLRALSILLVLIAGLYLAGMVWALLLQFADILVLFFFAWLVAFMLEPAVAMVQERRGVRRPWAVSLVYLALLVVLVATTFWLAPTIVNQVAL